MAALDPHSEVVDQRRRWKPEWYEYISGLDSSGASTVFYATILDAIAANVPVSVEVLYVAGILEAGDGGAAMYVASDTEPAHAGKFQTANGRWFGLGMQRLNVRMFGVLGNGDESALFQGAIDSVQLILGGGGVLEVPPGSYTAGGLSIDSTTGIVHLIGEGPGSVSIRAPSGSSPILTIDNGWVVVSGIFFLGPGLGDAVFGPSASTIVVDTGAIFCVIRDCFAWGGLHALEIVGNDNIFLGLDCGYCWGSSIVYAETSANFFIRCKFDQIFPFNNQSWGTSTPAARANSTAYTTGTIVSFSGYYWQCMVAGTSGVGTPTPQVYSVDVSDGATLKWQLVCPTTYHSMKFDKDCNENQLFQVDMTGAFTSCMRLSNDAGGGAGPQHTKLSQCIAGQSLFGAYELAAGFDASFSDCEFSAGTNTTSGFGMKLLSTWSGGVSMLGSRIFGTSKYGLRLEGGVGNTFQGNRIIGTFDFGASFAANTTDFNFSNNVAQGTTATIQVDAGTSDRYVIVGNLVNGSAPVDGGSGANKAVSANF